ncbi:alpha-L-fucosidase [Streptomyces inhibens]|uniref:alpha-L-fucosidase n=1 Tax=Streptomyces inhibens TaxID=2293571 RepID=UPI0037B3B6C4
MTRRVMTECAMTGRGAMAGRGAELGRRMRAYAVVLAGLALLLGALALPGTAYADLQHPRQNFLRGSVSGLFLHWGERTAPHHTSCSGWEKDVTTGGWSPDYWVKEAGKLHAQYLVLASFHSRLGYARPWPSKIPGSCHTQRDFLGELITAAKAKGLKVILYMTDDPQWHNDGGHEWLDSDGYSRYKGRNVDLTTRDGFGEFSYDNFFEVMDRYPELGGFWIDNDNDYWLDHHLYEQIYRLRPQYTLSNNNEDTPVMDMISNEQKTGMSPSYDYPQATYTAAPRLTEADFKLPSSGAWWYDGSDPAVDRKLTLGRLITNAGSSIKALMAETAQVNGRFPAKQEAFNNSPTAIWTGSGSPCAEPQVAAISMAVSRPASGTTVRTVSPPSAPPTPTATTSMSSPRPRHPSSAFATTDTGWPT